MQDNNQMNSQFNSQKQSLAVPIAIVIAGALIAVGIYLGGGNSGGTANIQNQPVAKPSDINIKALSSEDHIRGSINAPIVMVEYSDIECPFCKNFHSTLQRIVSEYDGNTEVAWAYRHFPIEQLHRNAIKESQATECAADQGKFWEYLDEIFRVTPSNDGLAASQLPVIASTVGLDVNKFNTCLNSTEHLEKITNSVKEAATAGANGTPASFLILKKAMSEKTAEDLSLAFTSMKLPQELYKIDKDRNIVFISGALPYDMIKATIDIILGKN